MFRRSSFVLCVALLFVASCKPLGGDSEVEATILVVKKTPVDVLAVGTPANAQGYIEDYIATQMLVIRSPAVIGRAVRMPVVANVKKLENSRPEVAVDLVRDALTVQRLDPKGNVLTLALTWPDAMDGQELLKAILLSYEAFLDETYKTVSDRTLELILEAKRVLGKGLEQAEQSYQDFRTKNPFLIRGPDQAKMTFATMSALEDKKAANLASRAELEGRLAWAEKAISDKSDTLAFQLKVNEWMTRSGFDKLPGEARKNLDPQQAYISVLKQDLAENQAIQKQLDLAIGKEHARMRDMLGYELKEEQLRNSIAAHRVLFDNIVKRLQEVNLVKDFGGYEARIVAPPRVKTK